MDIVRATTFKALGKAGATNGAALAGGTASGAPTAPAGPFDVGDMIPDATGKLWICTTAGSSQSSPGSFTQVGGTTSPLSTKGDVWVYGSADARLGVGSDTQVLTADSTQSLGVKWAAGSGSASALASASYTRTSGNYSTTSSTFAAVDATNMNLTLSTGARRCLVGFTGSGQHNSTNGELWLDVALDGTRLGGNQGLVNAQAYLGTAAFNISFSYLTDALTAASHTFELMFATSGGTAILYGSSGPAVNVTPGRFWVVELYA